MKVAKRAEARYRAWVKDRWLYVYARNRHTALKVFRANGYQRLQLRNVKKDLSLWATKVLVDIAPAREVRK